MKKIDISTLKLINYVHHIINNIHDNYRVFI